jgi:hypothetical protein
VRGRDEVKSALLNPQHLKGGGRIKETIVQSIIPVRDGRKFDHLETTRDFQKPEEIVMSDRY